MTPTGAVTPRWCILYRIKYADGAVGENGARSWAETADEAVRDLRRGYLPKGASLEVVEVQPWTPAHYTTPTWQFFAALKDGS